MIEIVNVHINFMMIWMNTLHRVEKPTEWIFFQKIVLLVAQRKPTKLIMSHNCYFLHFRPRGL